MSIAQLDMRVPQREALSSQSRDEIFSHQRRCEELVTDTVRKKFNESSGKSLKNSLLNTANKLRDCSDGNSSYYEEAALFLDAPLQLMDRKNELERENLAKEKELEEKMKREIEQLDSQGSDRLDRENSIRARIHREIFDENKGIRDKVDRIGSEIQDSLSQLRQCYGKSYLPESCRSTRRQLFPKSD